MTRDEVALVLTKCSSFDQRTIGIADVDAWFEIIGTFPFDATMRAVADHYRTETARIMPAHIRRIIMGGPEGIFDRLG